MSYLKNCEKIKLLAKKIIRPQGPVWKTGLLGGLPGSGLLKDK
jgi:hypothetical protein